MMAKLQQLIFIISCLLNHYSHADLKGYKFGLDPGHGGKDVGAIGNGLQEKSVTLATALAVKKYLELDGAKVVMTRSTDKSVTPSISGRQELVARARFLNSKQVQYTISIHYNAAASRANGTLAYIARGDCNAPHQSGQLAYSIVTALKKVVGLTLMKGGRGSSRLCRGKAGVFAYGVVMVVDTNMPALLAEVSFITNPWEAKKLKNPDYIKRNAWAIYTGIVNYIGGGRKPLPYMKNNFPPKLLLPANNAENQTLANIVFSWQNENPKKYIKQVTFSLQEALNKGKLPQKPKYIRCEGKTHLAVGMREKYSPAGCDALQPNRWYYWRIMLDLKDKSKQIQGHYFKTKSSTN